ncbi:conserved Plasmodium protein, unknown function [Plasmodium vinckei vinckei]|uniref:Uncharacterized protein n=1 Tax=Plasmodium vinckei vinckei TaxID=54757 RepID=A0A449BQ51_PLAVN|nr:conserved Plasmodium protein, unknown function [Plasmodium vinckei vinckei]VEV55509.1 conserved Plasmodium protein, unknown function [Plasmodium vinckei vinckei]
MQNSKNCNTKTKKKDGHHNPSKINKNNVNIKDIKTLYNIFSSNIQTESDNINCTDKTNEHASSFLMKKENYNNNIDSNNKKESHLFCIPHDNYNGTKTSNLKKEDNLFLSQISNQKQKDIDFDFFSEYNEKDQPTKLTKIKHLDKNKNEINSTTNLYQPNHDPLLYLNEIDDVNNFEKNEKNNENISKLNNDGMDKPESIMDYNCFDENRSKIEKVEQKENDITISKMNDIFIGSGESQNIEWEKIYEPFDKEFEKNISFEKNKQDTLNTSILSNSIFFENEKNNYNDLDLGNETWVTNEMNNYDINIIQDEVISKEIFFPFDFNSNAFPKTSAEESIYNNFVFNDNDSDMVSIKNANILDDNTDIKKEMASSSENLIQTPSSFNFNNQIQINKNDELFEKIKEQRNNDIPFKDIKPNEDPFILSEKFDELILNTNMTSQNDIDSIFKDEHKACYKISNEIDIEEVENYSLKMINEKNKNNSNENNTFLKMIEEIENVSKDIILDHFKLETNETIENDETNLETNESIYDPPNFDNKIETIFNNITEEYNKSIYKETNESEIHFENLQNVNLPDFTQIQSTFLDNKTKWNDVFASKQDEDIFVSKKEEDIFVSKQDEDIFVSKQEEDIFVSKQDENIFVSKQEEDIFVSKKEEDIFVSKKEKDIIVSKQDEDIFVSKQEEDIFVSKQEEDIFVSKQDENIFVSKQEEDIFVSKKEEDIFVSKKEEDIFVSKKEKDIIVSKQDQVLQFYEDIYNILINKNYLDIFLTLKKNNNINNDDMNIYNFHIYLKNVKKIKKRGFNDMYDYTDYIHKFIEDIYQMNVKKFFFYNIYIDNINKCIKKKNLLINSISNSYNFVNDFYKKHEKILTHDMFYKNVNYSLYFLFFINTLIELWKKIIIKIKNINIILLLKKFINIFKKNKIAYALKQLSNYLQAVYDLLNRPIQDEGQTKIKKIIKIIIKSKTFKTVKKYVYKINNSSFHFTILFSLISIPPYKKTATIFDHLMEYFFKNINKILLKQIKDTFQYNQEENNEKDQPQNLSTCKGNTKNVKEVVNNIIKSGKNNICLIKIKNFKQLFLQNGGESNNETKRESGTSLLNTLTDIKINDEICLFEKELELYIKYNISFYRLFFKFIIPLVNKITTTFENLETFFTLYVNYKIKKKKKLFFFYNPWIYSYDTFLSFSQINIMSNSNNLKKDEKEVIETDQELEIFSNQIKTNILIENSKNILNLEQSILYYKQLDNDITSSNIFNLIDNFYDFKNINQIFSHKNKISVYHKNINKQKDTKNKININYNHFKNYYSDILNLCYDERYIKINTRALKYLFFNLHFN